MNPFEKIGSPCGVPVFHQRLPDIIKSSSIALVVFVGSADDASVNASGIYHWFEHVPFRGTKNFPGGYSATKGGVTKVGGHIGASTGKFRTEYSATLPTRHFQKGLEVVIDLVAHPLMLEASVLAERKVIHQEIRGRMSSLGTSLDKLLSKVLYGDHPVGSGVLGTIESLDEINPDKLVHARNNGYDRSRMAFFASTSIPERDLLSMISDLFELLPVNCLSERRKSPSFGELPWSIGQREEILTDIPQTRVCLLFPSMFTEDSEEEFAKSLLFLNLFGHGGLSSPLYRLVRENKQLCYSASTTDFECVDGGHWGFVVGTSRQHISDVESELSSIFRDSQVRSKCWFGEIKEAFSCSEDMEIIHPSSFVSKAINGTVRCGRPLDRKRILNIIQNVSHQEVLAWLDGVNSEDSRTVVYVGKD